LRFERRYPKQNSVFRRELNILVPQIFCPPQTFLRGYAILSRHQFFIIQNFEQLALALKNRVTLNFFTVLKCVSSLRMFDQLALALKTEFALIFSSQGGGRLPASYTTGQSI